MSILDRQLGTRRCCRLVRGEEIEGLIATLAEVARTLAARLPELTSCRLAVYLDRVLLLVDLFV
jgi:hypothetical protein